MCCVYYNARNKGVHSSQLHREIVNKYIEHYDLTLSYRNTLLDS